MSLINDALKKAQRQRSEEQAGSAPPMPGGGGTRPTRRSSATPIQTIVLFVAGGIVLFVVCVVGAVLWINRPEPAKSLPPKIPVAPATATETPVATSPVIVLPATAIKPAEPAAAPAGSTAAVALAPVITTAAGAAQGPSSAGIVPPAITPASMPEITPPLAPPKGKFQESTQKLVDALRVSGIRALGNESKVLLNERVYKMNDIVDRPTGLRLTKVASDGLTFTTPDGVTYDRVF